VLELSDIEDWRSYASDQRAKGLLVGFVPTMGALHAGHISLFRAAKIASDVVLASLFVNPRQFDRLDDLAKYPRTPESDLALARECGVDCVVAPSLSDMWPDYPAPTPTTVSVGELGQRFEGAGRPGHFDGVASVVAKLFTITGPCRSFFGEKDFQQLAVIRQMVGDLGFDVEVVGCPIVRDDDGLALSSRNVALTEETRRRALGLSQALGVAAETARPASTQRALMHEAMERAGVDVAYAEVVDPATLLPSNDFETGPRRALVAGFIDGIRLLDNGPVSIVEG
jgi:pantoate--beta-alanine ligase